MSVGYRMVWDGMGMMEIKRVIEIMIGPNEECGECREYDV